MKVIKFLDLGFRKRGLELTHHYYINLRSRDKRVPWWFIQQTRKLTSEIDFSKVCQFDKNGFCDRENSGFRGSFKTAMCCCRNCGEKVGYLYQIPKDVGIIEILAKNFNNKTGFWRKGKGCILIREYRSQVCIQFICGRRHVLSDREKLVLDMTIWPFVYYRRFSRCKTCKTIHEFVDFELKKLIKEELQNKQHS